VTGKAKSAIRRALRQQDRERFIKLGRELARAAFGHVRKRVTEKVLETAARALRLPSGNEVLARLGSSEITARQLVEAVYPELTPADGEQIDRTRAVIGLSPGQKFDPAPCCQPLPGERIVGITFRGKGVQIHAIDCARMTQYESQPERWVDLRWQTGANISDLVFLDRKPDFYRLLIYVELRDLAHLHSLMRALEAESDVASIERFRDQMAAGREEALVQSE